MEKIKLFLMAGLAVVMTALPVTASEKGSMNDMKGSPSGEAMAAAKYDVDQSHSMIGFKVRHLGIGNTRGNFTDYTATVNYDPNDLSSFHASAVIQAKSVDTQHDGRDEHLRNEDFFAVEEFPEIKFESTAIKAKGDGHVITGDLTIKDVTKSIDLDVELAGPITSPFGGEVISIIGEGEINRQDFNVSWSKSLDAGGLVVGNKVKLIIEIEAHRK